MSQIPVTNVFTNKTIYLGRNSDIIIPWELSLTLDKFIKVKIIALMQKILTDCYRFSTKITTTETELLLFDSIVHSPASFGLISRIAKAMANEEVEYLVIAAGIIRKADDKEKKKIDKEYAAGQAGTTGIILDFRDYMIRDLLGHYFAQIYNVEQAMNNSIALGGSIQLKIHNYREKIGAVEANGSSIQQQATQIVKFAKEGKPVVIDALDEFEQFNASQNVSIAESTKSRIYQEIASALGCTVSYIIGVDDKTNGSGDSYERLDGRNEDCIHNFWLTVFEPIVSLFLKVKLEFVTQKWLTIKENVGTIMSIESLTSLPDDVKANVINRLIGDIQLDKPSETETAIKTQLTTNSTTETI